MNTAHHVCDDEKRAALEQVLQSATFTRANQVRNFLRYICEMELAGRGAALHEYLIAVEAMGRPVAYSTDTDSSVRRRAFALRQKLESVYATELSGARIRIEVPKGSYQPRFVEVASRPEAFRLKPEATLPPKGGSYEPEATEVNRPAASPAA